MLYYFLCLAIYFWHTSWDSDSIYSTTDPLRLHANSKSLRHSTTIFAFKALDDEKKKPW